MNKKKRNIIIVIVVFLLSILALWISGIIPKQIARVSATNYLKKNFPKMQMEFESIEWNSSFGGYSIRFKDENGEIHGFIMNNKYFPIEPGQGKFALEEEYREKYEKQNIDNKTASIEEKIKIISQNGQISSSNPFDYIEANKDIYNELLNTPTETFEYAIKDLIKNNANNGLTSYIEASLCNQMNPNFKYEFESGIDYLEHYKKFLLESDAIFNEYDMYAESLLK